jgi:DNA processing protein
MLFVRGQIPTLPTVAIVGTRRCTTYGRHLAFEYGGAVADAGWCVSSGLARGIDGAAHKGVTSAGGVGVAVLGCGVDVAYPAEHAALASALVSGGGGVITEYPPGSPPEPWRFPPRNRIISGMAAAVVVVEAAVTGGALITAGYALTQGRVVFAVPGDIRRASSAGCNLLIRDGAHPVLDPDDLIEELSLVLGQPVARGGGPSRVAAP